MRDAHGRVGRVDALPAGATAPVDVDAQVVLVDRHLDVLGLGHDEHAGRRRVDAPLALGHGHPLHPVHATLVLQPRPRGLVETGRALGLDRDAHVLVAAEVALGRVLDHRAPAALLGVAQIHPQQVAGEERGLVAALPCLDLEDDVAVVVGVARHEHPAQMLLGRCLSGLERGHLGGEGLVLGRELAGRAEVVDRSLPRPCRGDGGRQGGIPLVEGAHEVLVGVDRRLGEATLELGVLVEDRLHGFEHDDHLSAGDVAVKDERRPPTTEVVGAGVRETYLAAFLP